METVCEGILWYCQCVIVLFVVLHMIPHSFYCADATLPG